MIAEFSRFYTERILRNDFVFCININTTDVHSNVVCNAN